MNVLSLFDGMSCGQLALQRAGIKIDKYYASEIDESAIQITQKNFPNTIQLGDVTEWREWNLPKIDLLIGGSPCQGFSYSGKGLNFSDPRSKLFFEYADILNHYEPKYFLLENVKMKKEWQDVISSYLGVEPVKINSALVSAQNRERLYWTNISNIEQPNDLEIFVYDILEDNVDEKYYMSEKWHKWWEENKDFQLRKKYSALNPDKAITMKARQYANWNGNFICGAMRGRYLENGIRKDGKGKPTQRIEVRFDSKTNCLTTVQKDNLLINESENRIRRFTPIECERLQTLPDNYTAGVNDSQRYKMLGNGWTVNIISHILGYIKT